MSVPEFFPDPKTRKPITVEQIEGWSAYVRGLEPTHTSLEGLADMLEAAAKASREIVANAKRVRGRATVRRTSGA